MQRKLLTFLNSWLIAKDRKPLVIRGARQVGKTWLVRYFAENSGKQLIELNFEKQPRNIEFFNSNDPQQILINLSAVVNHKIDPENSLLFLDEIQVVPQLLAKLRWFAEDLPALPVITTGSLLEFVLADHTFSMPVGRINYAHLEPLSFEEFLLAKDKRALYDYLLSYDFNFEIPFGIHEQLAILFKEYLLVGGLPAAVLSWVTEQSFSKVNQIQNDLFATYRDDFTKYKTRIDSARIDETMLAIPRMLGQKFVYSKVNSEVQTSVIKQATNLLGLARIAHKVQACAANGVPLGAEIKTKYFKEILLDVGLCSVALGLNLQQVNAVKDIVMINSGGIAEQIVGQMLRTIEPAYIEPNLYYWLREETGSNAEVDYILQHENRVIPIEVKAGATGSLKSLHLFMGIKKYPFAIRINSELPSKVLVDVKDHAGNVVKYTLLSIPFYLVGQVHRICSFY